MVGLGGWARVWVEEDLVGWKIGWPASQQVLWSKLGDCRCGVVAVAELWGDMAGRDGLIQNIGPGSLSQKGLFSGPVAKCFHHIPIR